MADISITRMSSKGQIVIPSELREGIIEGEKLVVIRNKNQLIIEKVKDFSKNLEEDLEFAKRTEEAWKRYDQGKMTKVSAEEFLDLIEKW